MPHVRFNESFTPLHPPRNAVKRQPIDDEATMQRNPVYDAHCTKCNSVFGKVYNKFEKVTGSYSLLHEAPPQFHLRPEGRIKDSRSEALQGW